MMEGPDKTGKLWGYILINDGECAPRFVELAIDPETLLVILNGEYPHFQEHTEEEFRLLDEIGYVVMDLYGDLGPDDMDIITIEERPRHLEFDDGKANWVAVDNFKPTYLYGG